MNTSTRGAEIPPKNDPRHGSGRDLFNPVMERVVLGPAESASSPGNPGARIPWDRRPKWHGLVYGNGKPGTGRESIVSSAALFAYPLVFNEHGHIAPPPQEAQPITEESLRRHAERFGPEGVREVALKSSTKMSRVAANGPNAPKRRRRTTQDLVEQVTELHTRGLAATAIADTLNLGDRRVREIITALAKPPI